MAKDKIALADMLAQVAKEIRAAHEAASAGEDPVMKFQECELEFAVEIENKGEGGVNIWCLKLGGGRKKTESNTVKVKYSSVGTFVAQIQAPQGARTAPKRTGKKKKKS